MMLIHTKTLCGMRKFSRWISVVLILAFCNMMAGCTYYKVKQPENEAAAYQKVQNARSYAILHQGAEVWHLSDIKINNDQKEITASLKEVSPWHQSYRTTKVDRNNRYKKKLQQPINEIHFYVNDFDRDVESRVTIPMSSVNRVEVYDHAVGANVLSAVGTAAGITVGTLTVIAIIALLTKSSCPFVYIEQGESFVFSGEMYGGAISSQLERDDYMPLTGLSPQDGNYRLAITNELLERQYTDLAELLVVSHPEDAKVLFDQKGNLQSITEPQAAREAVGEDQIDYSDLLLAQDNASYLFDSYEAGSPAFSSVALAFKKPADAKTGKLVIHAKNSLWLDYAYGLFNEQFGTLYNKFAEKQQKKSAGELMDWSLEQSIPLQVYLQIEGEWKFVDYFQVIGPLASRDLVMPIDLSQHRGENVKIKLACGFMFWEIDYAAMDFAENIALEVHKISPASAIDETGKEVSHLLTASDKSYLVQPEVGNAVVVEYPAGASVGNMQQSCFLHSRGYYEYIRSYSNKPNFAKLNLFKKKGGFTHFAKEQYDRLMEKPLVLSASMPANEN